MKNRLAKIFFFFFLFTIYLLKNLKSFFSYRFSLFSFFPTSFQKIWLAAKRSFLLRVVLFFSQSLYESEFCGLYNIFVKMDVRTWRLIKMCFVTVRFYFSSIFFEFFSCKAIALLSKTYYLYLILIYIDVNFFNYLSWNSFTISWEVF